MALIYLAMVQGKNTPFLQLNRVDVQEAALWLQTELKLNQAWFQNNALHTGLCRTSLG